ncbi:MAG TPA: trimethylamine methyltransferase family protein [Actinomycetota bacterium]|nr:trimethylamine methyltransferase family protein [Actinomycetota bacterium]
MADREIRSVQHRRPPVDIMPDEAVAAIREASAEVLWRTGIQVRSDALLKQLEAAGAVIEEEDSRARFPKELQTEALASVPGDLPLSSREPGLDVILDGTRGYLGVDGNAAEVVDLDTDQRRASRKDDVAMGTLIGDALPQIGYIWQPAVSREMPVPSEPLHNLEANLNNTGKHIVMMTAVTPEQAEASSQMAAIAAGGEQALKDRPILSAFQCSVSPLVYDGGPLAAAVEFARCGVPSGFMVMPILGATSPITRGGTLVVSNAEVIGGVIAHQLLAPGARTFYASCATTMDLWSGAATCGGPEDLVFQMANAQLARSYGLKSMVGTFATGSKTSDWQGGAENGMSGFASWISGVDMASGAGLLYAARVFSPTQLVLDAELWDLICSMSEGVRGWDAESLAVDVIDAVKPGGHFLDQDHTLTHMREVWQSKMFDRGSWEDWEKNGRPLPAEKAKKQVREIIETHRPYPLPDGASDAIRSIVERFEKEHPEAA